MIKGRDLRSNCNKKRERERRDMLKWKEKEKMDHRGHIKNSYYYNFKTQLRDRLETKLKLRDEGSNNDTLLVVKLIYVYYHINM